MPLKQLGKEPQKSLHNTLLEIVPFFSDVFSPRKAYIKATYHSRELDKSVLSVGASLNKVLSRSSLLFQPIEHTGIQTQSVARL